MALPVTLSSVSLSSYYDRMVHHYNGAIYIVIRGSNNAWITVQKSTDPSNSGFSEQDSSNRPEATGGDGYEFLDSCQDAAGNIHIIGHLGVAHKYTYHKFDMDTDTWTITDEDIVDVSSAAPSTPYGASIAVRSDGEVVVGYAGAKETVGSARDRTKAGWRSTGGTWTVGIAVDGGGSISYGSVVVQKFPSDDRIAFWYKENVNNDLHVRVMATNHTMNTDVEFDTTTAGASGNIRSGAVFNQSGTDYLAIIHRDIEPSSNNVSLSYFSPADVPTVSQAQGISPSVRDNVVGTLLMQLMATPEGDLTLVVVNNTDGDIYFDDSVGSLTGWGTDVSVVTGSFVHLTATLFERSGNYLIGYVYHNGSSFLYNEYDTGLDEPAGISIPVAYSHLKQQGVA